MKISRIRDVKLPTRNNSTDAGIDFFVPNDFPLSIIKPHKCILIPSGIKANVPDGFALIAFNKSGVATKKNLIVGAAVVDSCYQGEIHLHLMNNSPIDTIIESGEKIVQFILLPVGLHTPTEVHIDELYEKETKRGSSGFGSSGAK